ncbi:MAG: FliH/SctL family protein [Spirochaetaceae bacterium]|nr:FliH/SctL family protein [Spirochaetaceae bacterium]
MAKNIFHPRDIIQDNTVAYISAPSFGGGLAYDSGAAVRDDLPSADDLHQEAEAILEKARQEALAIVAKAQSEATEIVNKAGENARSMAEQTKDDLASARANFAQEHEAVLEKAAGEAELLKANALAEVERIKTNAHKEGEQDGYEAGYDKGYEEVSRLVTRLHTIINRTVDKRNVILGEVESQVIELTLLMVRKIVKVLAENQKGIVVSNIIEALRKLKIKSDVVVRVNMDDLELATQRSEVFVREIEGDGKLSFIEDNSIEKGGCIIETDFGQIDARISSQLSEIENRIRDLMPINVRPAAID